MVAFLGLLDDLEVAVMRGSNLQMGLNLFGLDQPQSVREPCDEYEGLGGRSVGARRVEAIVAESGASEVPVEREAEDTTETVLSFSSGVSATLAFAS